VRYKQLGESGLTVSVLGLGCNNFSARVDQAGATAIVDACFERGVTFFDTSDYYGDSEVYLGDALTGRRDEAVIATKFGLDRQGRIAPEWEARGSRRFIRRAVETSLRRLRTDYIDLYQQHVPDPRTPLEETITALDELVREGKVRYVGCSNLPAWRVADAQWIARSRGLARFVSSQSRYSLLERGIEADLVPACLHFGMGVIAYFPLANGLLTGKYRRGEPPPAGARLTDMTVPWQVGPPRARDQLSDDNFARVEAIEAYARRHGATLLEVALGGLIDQPGVATVIAGASRPEQVHANAVAAGWEPTADQVAELDRVTRGLQRP
jgi:aryl-alcohol dehydrogenase-like predicted oxidoreductase